MSALHASEMMRLVNGYQISQSIHVAATLGIADHLAQGPRTSDDLAEATSTHPPTLYRLLRALASIGVFHEGDNRTFSLTELGSCLQSNSATPIAPWAIFIGRPYMWEAWAHLLHSVRTGENAFRHVHGRSNFEYRSLKPAEQAIFDQAMSGGSRGLSSAVMQALDFAQFGTIIDVGGGEGALLVDILSAHPKLRGVLFDQPNVIARADTFLQRGGVRSRCDLVGGSFFELGSWRRGCLHSEIHSARLGRCDFYRYFESVSPCHVGRGNIARSRKDDRSTERRRRRQVRRLKHAGGAWRSGAHRRRICEPFQRCQLQADKDHSNGHANQFDRRSSFLGRACIVRNFAVPLHFEHFE